MMNAGTELYISVMQNYSCELHKTQNWN